MKKNFLLFAAIVFAFLFIKNARADNIINDRYNGKIFLQVEAKGEAWYVSPQDQKRYFLGRPADAFELMKKFGLGITNADLKKIPIGIVNYQGMDSDSDGLPDALETAIGTDPKISDSDNDGYADKTEIQKNYNPSGSGGLNIDSNLIKRLSGNVLLQAQSRGEAWYINPSDKKRYFLGSPDQAFYLIKTFGIGIKDVDLIKIAIGNLINDPRPIITDPIPAASACNINTQPEAVMGLAAEAIRKNQLPDMLSCFIPEMAKGLEFTLDFLQADGRLALGNILSGSSLTAANDTEKKYSNQVYFSLGGYNTPVNFFVRKQPDGSWKITNL